jgi:hypothetical protein
MPDLDELTTEVFNAVGKVRWPDSYEPIDCFAVAVLAQLSHFYDSQCEEFPRYLRLSV